MKIGEKSSNFNAPRQFPLSVHFCTELHLYSWNLPEIHLAPCWSVNRCRSFLRDLPLGAEDYRTRRKQPPLHALQRVHSPDVEGRTFVSNRGTWRSGRGARDLVMAHDAGHSSTVTAVSAITGKCAPELMPGGDISHSALTQTDHWCALHVLTRHKL